LLGREVIVATILNSNEATQITHQGIDIEQLS